MNTESHKYLVALSADQIKALVQAAEFGMNNSALERDDPGAAGELAAALDHLSFLLNADPTPRRFIASEGPNAEFSIIDCFPFGPDADTASVFAVCNSAPGSLNSYGRGHLLVKMLNAANASGALGELV